MNDLIGEKSDGFVVLSSCLLAVACLLTNLLFAASASDACFFT